MSFVDLEESKCIFGNELDGRCNIAELKEYLVLLKGAWAKVCKMCSEKNRSKADYFAKCFSIFSGELNSEIKGNRLCAYPKEGYSGPKRGLEKKPTKFGKHAGYFNVKGSPALCFTDLKPSREKVKLAVIRIP